MIPHRQILGVLSYLWEQLRSDAGLLRYIGGPDQIVASTIARDPMGETTAQRRQSGPVLHSQGAPYLAVWTDGFAWNRGARANVSMYDDDINLAWVTPVLAGGWIGRDPPSDKDGLTLTMAQCNLVAKTICRRLACMPAAVYGSSGIEEIAGGRWNMDNIGGLCFAHGSLVMSGKHLPYTEDESPKLRKVITKINLQGTAFFLDMNTGIGQS